MRIEIFIVDCVQFFVRMFSFVYGFPFFTAMDWIPRLVTIQN